MRILRPLKLMLIPTILVACSSLKSPDLIPCMCDGDDQTLGILNCMCEPGKKKPSRQVAYIQDEAIIDENINPSDDQKRAYAYLHQSRNTYAPVQLEFVDFRIPSGRSYEDYNQKLGNYRFRIFGCRRFDKEVYLNQGRAMQKDMKFFDTFFETMNDYYPVVVDKSNPYYSYSDKAQPEYVMTAEINDYFMNVCDEYDWDKTKKQDSRTGSAEMTVTWRLMDLTKSKVYCKGTTTGYSDMKNGEYKGETLLVERAFADALTKLPEIECYNDQLAQRVDPKNIEAQLQEIASLEAAKRNFKNEYNNELQGIKMLKNCGSGLIAQNGGALGNGMSPQGGINQNGGTNGTGHKISGYIDQNGNFVADSGGIDGSGSAITNNGGANGSGNNIATPRPTQEIQLNSNCSEVTVGQGGCTTMNVTKNNIKWGDDYWIDIPADASSGSKTLQSRIDADNMFSASNNFCIQNVKPYDKMSPENVYKLRASVVEVTNPNGKKGAGLILSDQLILTSADLLDKQQNRFGIKTINGMKFNGSAYRVNPNKNVALILLDDKTKFAPLPLSLALPEVGKDLYMTLGLLDFEEGENYLDTEGQVIGYRYSEEKGAEIIVNTYVQTQTLGSALIDKSGNITGLSHSGVRAPEGGDLFIPIETALRSLGMEICGVKFTTQKPTAIKTIDKPVSEEIDNQTGSKDPAVMNAKERK